MDYFCKTVKKGVELTSLPCEISGIHFLDGLERAIQLIQSLIINHNSVVSSYAF